MKLNRTIITHDSLGCPKAVPVYVRIHRHPVR